MSFKYKLKKILGKPALKQEELLRMALWEEGIRKAKLEIDHINGINVVNGVELPIIYPASFFGKVSALNQSKKYDFYFNGYMPESGGRKELLAPFFDKKSKIISSDVGRKPDSKTKFNLDYFQGLAQSKYGLCPHQKDFKGIKDTMWTYRFIECCMVKSIPVIFKETPLGSKFLEGFSYLYDDADFTVEHGIIDLQGNYELCIRRHSFINNDYLKKIQ